MNPVENYVKYDQIGKFGSFGTVSQSRTPCAAMINFKKTINLNLSIQEGPSLRVKQLSNGITDEMRLATFIQPTNQKSRLYIILGNGRLGRVKEAADKEDKNKKMETGKEERVKEDADKEDEDKENQTNEDHINLIFF
ncbi:hypothetical protein SNEBB_006146 [Seison nebaliae]|nr:hypothetical protein SNEBB_006146 [Seison nebaliae]